MNKQQLRTICWETSARRGSVAAALGTELLRQEHFSADQQHTAELFPTISRLCEQLNWAPADIDQIMVSIGPGSFTGIRVGITAAKSLAYALSIPVIPVPSTDVMALNALQNEATGGLPANVTHIATVMDAKRGQVYTALYSLGDTPDSLVPGLTLCMEPSLLNPDELLAKAPHPLWIVGEGLRYHARNLTSDDVTHAPQDLWMPLAENVLRCGLRRARAGLSIPAEQLQPLYLRRPEAQEKWEALHGESA